MITDYKIEDPKVCVIVPCFNEEKTIRACLKALQKQTYLNYEILVVDDASEDNSSRIVREQGVRLISLKMNSGVARARNVGIKHCKAEVIAFTDADCVVEKDWLKKLIRTMIYQELDVVMGRIITPINQDNVIVKAQTGGRLVKKVKNESLGGGYSIVYKKKILDKLGGFNEKYKRGCEYEFNLRVLRSRFKFGWAENAIVKFSYADTIIKLWKQEFSNGFWFKEIMKVHPYFLKNRIKDLLARMLVLIFPFLYICFLFKNWRDYDEKKLLFLEGAVTYFKFLAHNSGFLLSIITGMLGKDIMIRYK